MQHVYQHVRFLVALFWNCNIQNNTLLRQRGRLSIGDFVPVFVSYNQLNLKDDQNLIVITHCYAIFERGGGDIYRQCPATMVQCALTSFLVYPHKPSASFKYQLKGRPNLWEKFCLLARNSKWLQDAEIYHSNKEF